MRLSLLPHYFRTVTHVGGHWLNTAREDIRVLLHRRSGRTVLRQISVDGFQIVVRADELVGRVLYCFGKYDPEVYMLLREVKPTDVCVDIGANIGFYTLHLARAAARVISFEPNAGPFHLLQMNVDNNRLRNVECHRAAVGRTEGVATFSIAQDSAYSSFRDTGLIGVSESVQVQVKRLDDCIERVDVLKIDVEGAEMEVLAGARELLSDPGRRPRVVLMEAADAVLARYGNSSEELLRTMREFGYAAERNEQNVLFRHPMTERPTEITAALGSVMHN